MLKFYKIFFTLRANQLKRIKKNIFSGFSSEIMQVFSQIFFAPLMIFFWGIENFGIWVFLLAIPNILTIFNINFTDASVNEMTIFSANKNYKKTNEVFQNSIVIVFFNVSFFLILFSFLYFFNQFESVVLKKISIDEQTIILFLLIITICLNQLETLFTSVLQSLGKIYIIFNTSNIIDLLMKFSIVFSGFFFNSLVYPAVIFLIFHLIRFFVLFYFFLIHKKKIYFSFRYFSLKVIKKLFKLSIGHTAQLMSHVIKHSGVILILGIFYSPYIIGFIATVKTLFYFLPWRFITKLNQIIYYEIANSYAKKKFSLLRGNFYNYLKLILLLLFVFIGISMVAGPFIYELWLKGKYELSFVFLLLIISDLSFSVIRHSIISIFVSINKNLLLGILEIILSLIVMFGFYLTLYFDYSYLVAFSVILLGSVINLIFSFKFLTFFFKKNKLN